MAWMTRDAAEAYAAQRAHLRATCESFPATSDGQNYYYKVDPHR